LAALHVTCSELQRDLRSCNPRRNFTQLHGSNRNVTEQIYSADRTTSLSGVRWRHTDQSS